MPDVEKVIKGLECCTTAIGCYECPYAVGEKATDACNLLIDRDALTLLKAQEPRAMADTELEAIRKAPLILKPAVDAVPVVHGRWIDENPDDSLDPRMRCSICTGVESPLLKWRYCPNCGAKMDGERRDEDA